MYRKGVVITIIFLFIGMSILPSTGSILLEKSTASTLDGNTLYVGGSGPGNYSRIQDAIDNASDGDTVFVYDDSSPYYENLDVNKIISLIGENRGTTVIDGSWIGDVVTVSADWVTISGFTIRNGELGIHIDSDYNTITGNNISNNGIIGIFIGNSHNNTITGNNSISNNGYGIIIGNSHNNTITDNNISNNWRGIYLDDSSNNTITGNNIISNGFYGGIYLDDSSNNTITGNNISNNEYGIGIGNSHSNTILGNNIISNNGIGIVIGNSCNNTITDNNISNNGWGIYLDGFFGACTDNIISGNNISNNEYGIGIDDSSNNTITDNNISNNWIGIGLYYSSSNAITGNIISNNEAGIYLDDSSNNTITGNNISNNGIIGIFIGNSHNNTITGNNSISNNEYGIYLRYSSSNTVTDNSISNNGWGIYLDESSNNTITGNSIISNNLDGILLYSSSNNNTIYHNNFINNSQNAHDECDNTWDDGEYGNYWSDYEERYPDAKKKWWKGIWDTPYEIPGGDSKDMCPLIKQWPDPYPYNNNQVQSKNNVVKKTINTITSQTSNQQQSTQHKPVIPKISRATPKSVPDTKTSARTNSILEL